MAVIADRRPDLEVTVVDLNEQRIAAWNDSDPSKLPCEPGLMQSWPPAAATSAFPRRWMSRPPPDMVFISVNTPTKTKGVELAKP